MPRNSQIRNALAFGRLDFDENGGLRGIADTV
jgi:hypothetical protein